MGLGGPLLFVFFAVTFIHSVVRDFRNHCSERDWPTDITTVGLIRDVWLGFSLYGNLF